MSSKTLDERVLSMKFDNSQFEANAKNTISTLDKLKEKLNFKDTSKGLENVSSNIKKVDTSPLSAGVEQVRLKFSMLEIAAITSLQRITNSALTAGKRLVSAFTTEPIRAGFQEYETQMNAVQTILANTKNKGSTLNDVTEALDELNTYADKTIYNFAEMTKNIGTFTAAGIDLKTSVSAIQGIANLAAVSGSTSQQASTAMYQLSQALATGTVKLMDWNSVVNAGMGGQVFQDALKETSRELNTGVDAAIKAQGSFRESLSTGWLTSEVLTETLKKFTTSGANEYVAKYTGLSTEMVEQTLEAAEAQYGEADAIKYASEELAKKSGKNKTEIQEALEFAQTAEDAATKVKTFSQLIDTLKEAAGSGWTKSWQIILGDFEEAKEFFTSLSDTFSEIINKSADTRNTILTKAFGSRWEEFSKKITDTGVKLSDFETEVKKVAKSHNVDVDSMIKKYGSFEKSLKSGWMKTSYVSEALTNMSKSTKETTNDTEELNKKLKNFQNTVKKIWNGEYKNSEERVKALTEAGYDYNKIQSLVNKTAKGQSITLSDISEKQLKIIGYTDDEILSVKKLSEQAKKSSSDIDSLVESLSKPTGRELFIGSIQNIIKIFTQLGSAIHGALYDVFSIDDRASAIYTFLESFQKITKNLILTDDNAVKLRKTLKGLFSVIKIISTFMNAGFKIAFSVVNGVLENFNLGILDVTASVGDAVYSFSKWITANTILTKGINIIVTVITKMIQVIALCITTVRNWIDTFMKIETVQKIVELLGEGLEFIRDIAKDVFDKITIYISQFISELKSINGKDIKLNFSYVFNNILDSILNTLRAIKTQGLDVALTSITSSFDSFAKNNPITNAISNVQKGVENVGNNFEKALDNVHNQLTGGYRLIKTGIAKFQELSNSGIFDKALSTLIGYKTIKLVSASTKNLGQITASIVNFINQFAKIGQTLSKGFGYWTVSIPAAIKTMITNIDMSLKGLATAKKRQINVQSIWILVKAITVLAAAAIALGYIDQDKLRQGLIALGAISLIIAALFYELGAVNTKAALAGNVVNNGAVTLIAIAVSLQLIITAFNRLVSIMDAGPAKIVGALISLVVIFGLLIGALLSISVILSKVPDLNNSILALVAIAASLYIAVRALEVIGKMDTDELMQSVLAITYIFIGMSGLLAVASKAENLKGTAATLTGLAFSLIVMCVPLMILGKMNPSTLFQGIVGMYAVMVAFIPLIIASKKAGEYAASGGAMILACAVALYLMVGVVKIASLLTVGTVMKGLAVITALSLLFAGLIFMTKYAGENATKAAATILAVGVSLMLISAALMVLSLLDLGKLAGATACISAIMGMFALLIYASGNAGFATTTITSLALAIAALAGVLFLLSTMDTTKLIKATGILTVLILAFSVLVYASGELQASYKGVVLMALCVAGLAWLIWYLDSLNVQGSIPLAASLGILMIALAAAFKIMGNAQPLTKNALRTVVVLALIMAALGGVIMLITKYGSDLNQSLWIATAMSELVIALAAAARILSGAKDTSKGAIVGAAALTVCISALGAVIAVITTFGSNLNKSIYIATAMSELVIALAAATVVLSHSKSVNKSAIVAAAGLSGCISVLGGVIALITTYGKNLDKAIPVAVGLSAMLIPLATATVILSHVGLNATAGIAAAYKVVGLVTVIGTIAAAIAVVLSKINGLGPALDTGFNILSKITSGIGKVIGSLIGGFVKGLQGDQMVEMAKSFTKFITNIMPALVVLKSFDNGAISKVKDLVTALKTLTTLDTISDETLDNVKNAMPKIGEALKKLSSSVSGELDLAAIESATKGAKYISEFMANLPRSGGWAQTILGEKDLSNFGSSAEKFAKAMVSISSSVGAEGAINVTAIQNLANAGGYLKDLLNALPKSGGWAQTILGDQNLSTFGSQVVAFADSMIAVSASIPPETGINVSGIQNMATAGGYLKDLLNALPKSGGWAQTILGEKDLSDFGSQLETFAKSMAEVSKTVSGKDTNFSGIQSMVVGLDTILASFTKVKDVTISDVSGFSGACETLASSVKKLTMNLDTKATTSITKLVTAMTKVKNIKSGDADGLVSSLKSLSALKSLNFSGITKSAGSLKSAVSSLMSIMKKTISGSKGGLTSAMQTAVSGMGSAVSKSSKSIVNFMKTTMNAVVSAVKSKKSSMTSAGKDLGAGLVKGINAKKQAAYNAGFALGQAAVKGEKAGQKSNSPSKETIKAGKWLGEGLVIGMDKMSKAVYKSGYSMGETASDTISSAISQIAGMMDSDISTQPTIRPVMDLSEVTSGTASINGMFSGINPTLGVSANLSAINATMQRNQNGASNDDVVNAINGLKRTINNTSTGNTYQINGVTYDDGSNISNAVQTLVDAARIERRS